MLLKGLFFFIILFSSFNIVKSQDTLSFSDTGYYKIPIEEVTVKSFLSRSKLQNFPGSISILLKEDLSRSDENDLVHILNSLPGIQMQSGTYTTNRITIRGMGSRTPYNTNRIRAYLDDIPLTTTDGISTPEEIDLYNVGRLEIVKGPASALYGSGLGGSINLFTPANTEDHGEFGLQYGGFNTFKTQFNGNAEFRNTRIWGSTGHLQSGGYRENSRYRRTSLALRAEHQYSRFSISGIIMITDIYSGIPSSLGKTLFENHPEAAASNWKAIQGYKRYFRALGGTTVKVSLSDKLTNNLTIFGRFYDNYERRPFNNLDDYSASGGLSNRLKLQKDRIQWTSGFEWITGNYVWEISTDSIISNYRDYHNHLNAFSLFDFQPFAALNISLAIAANNISYQLTDLIPADGDRSGDRKFPLILSPRAGISYAVGKNLSIYTSAGHGFSLPSPEETLLPGGALNPDIKHEQGFQYEIGSRFKHQFMATRIDLALYWIDLSNLLLTKRISEDIFTGINAGKTLHQGVEFTMKNRWFSFHRFPGSLQSALSGAYSLNRFKDFNDNGNIYDGKHLPGIPRHTYSLLLLWQVHDYFNLETIINHTGEQYLTDDNSQKYQGYWLIDIKVSSQITFLKKSSLLVYAGIKNMMNTHYASMLIVNAIPSNGGEPRYYYPGLPRHGYFGIKLIF